MAANTKAMKDLADMELTEFWKKAKETTDPN